MTLAAALAACVPALKILIPALIGWLFPSPFELLKRKQAKIDQAEARANDADHDVNGLDEMP